MRPCDNSLILIGCFIYDVTDAGSGLLDASTSRDSVSTEETPLVSTETGGTPTEFRPAQTGK